MLSHTGGAFLILGVHLQLATSLQARIHDPAEAHTALGLRDLLVQLNASHVRGTLLAEVLSCDALNPEPGVRSERDGSCGRSRERTACLPSAAVA